MSSPFIDAGIVLVNAEVVPVPDEGALLGFTFYGALVGVWLIWQVLKMNKRETGSWL
jgi:hypothetical protein